MCPLRISKLNITQFRSYETLRLDVSGAAAVVLTGQNGAGKTNILEAVSLLTPGRGLRGALLRDIGNRDAPPAELWAVAAEIMTPQGETTKIGTGLHREGRKRVVRIDGREAKGPRVLADVMAAVWLTPQMDRVFLEGPSARRRFLDRLVLSYQPAHATHLSRFEKNLRQRMKILQGTAPADAKWLDVLEENLAADAVAVTAARHMTLAHLAKHLLVSPAGDKGLFPVPRLSLQGWVDDRLERFSALQVEEDLKRRLRETRQQDALQGRTEAGPHRSDLCVYYAEKEMPADQCSTGEQKGLLISIVLAHVAMMSAEKGFAPLVLFDEVAAHLDDTRREVLFARLADQGAQVWLTGTSADIFTSLKNKAAFFDVRHGTVLAPPRLAAV